MTSLGMVGLRSLPRSVILRRPVLLLTQRHLSILHKSKPLLLHQRQSLRPCLPLFSLNAFYSTTASPPPTTPPPPPPPPAKKEKHENIYTIPNILTFTRLLSTPAIAYLILHHQPYLATALLLYAGLTDLVDGWIARKYNLKSVVGTIIDPMADKFLMITLTASLTWTGQLPVWLAVIILGRDVGLGIAALYYRWISLPPPKTMGRYWDFSLPSAEVHPTTISKLLLIGTTTIEPILAVDISLYLGVMQYVVATTTVWSGLSYVYSKDAVKILK